ncbi:hypothetical protein PHYSODRAFT_288430 [Phytophthora sojae]|uniref:RxLR effector protein n=2 Tax=Phytophthora sojae TaxID=67593 RepID=G5A447_PHYSP|nr:hypothetical protein PHYSODRAFT_288430 [Phytophthora sojae]AEK81199.1 Avh339 [Phytophthora sojae]AEK81200.1 Avh339 [Phytophthora sojae]AEK81201.1 Avh339 [Phytophthora sojae]EGZ09493.1 hypothetical protein PHYSODRAFT_288430 [Phytophthora sojae]|eukprot:XP_009534354.1 hypothetical protein PHYSODRAFT_288430 [Phytophthora sojae]
MECFHASLSCLANGWGSEITSSTLSSHSGVSAKRMLRIASYTVSDEERVPGTSSLESLVGAFKALKVSPQTIKNWMKKGNFADESFEALKLDKTLDTLIDNPQFTARVKYVDDFNEQHPKKQLSIYRTLKKHYTDDALLQTIEKAKLSPETERIAAILQGEQLQEWSRIGYWPGAVYRFLFKQHSYDGIFASINWKIWTKYLDDYNAMHSAKQVSMYQVLKAHYADEGLVKVLEKAELAPETKKLASRLHAEQLHDWLRSGYSPENVYLLLFKRRLYEDTFASPAWSTWTKYLGNYNMLYPEKKMTLFAALRELYTEHRVLTMINHAKRSMSTKSIGLKLEKDSLNFGWTNVILPVICSAQRFSSVRRERSSSTIRTGALGSSTSMT